MKKNLLMLCAAAGTLAASATDAPAEYKNVLGEGVDHATLTVTWGDNHSIDNLASAVRFDGTATVGSIITEALKDDPRFYALADTDGSYLAYGFDTDGDNSAAVKVGTETLPMTDGVAQSNVNTGLTGIKGSSDYDHWCVINGDSNWAVYVNGSEAAMTDEVSDGDAVRLIYGNAEEGEKFYLRPATQRGAWMMPSITFDTANGKTQTFPVIANVISHDDLYSGFINFNITDKDGNAVTTMSASGKYRYGRDGNNMTVELTLAADGDVVITPYIQTGAYKAEIHIPGDIRTQVQVTVSNKVTSIGLEGIEPGSTIELDNMGVLVVKPVYEPEDAFFKDYSFESANEGVVTMYKNVNSLVAHSSGTTTFTITSLDGNASATYNVKVKDLDTSKPDDDYQDGMIWLSEEWFGHTSGSLNYIDKSGNIFYRAYAGQNDNMAFGCTSQFATIYAGKLIVMSKQAWDGGDTRPVRSGGRTVIADAKTMKRIASFDEIGGDGRACVGVNPSKVYLGHTNGIRVLNLDNMTLADSDIPGIEIGRGQIGDMVVAGKYVFAANVGVGLVIIDATTDTFVKAIACSDIQGVVRAQDGRVWYAEKKKLTPIDPETLESGESYSIPGSITCSSGSWRHVNLSASYKSNTLFWGTGTFYRWDIDEVDDPSTLSPVYTHSYSEDGVRYGNGYGAPAYDDRTDTYMFATMPGFGTLALTNYLYFVDATAGNLKHRVKLDEYWWFPAMPVFPDKHLPALVNPDMRVEMAVDAEEPVEVDLHEAIDDMDGANKFIRFALVSEPQTAAEEDAAEPVAAEIKDGKLLLTPQKIGNTTVKLTAESNGREALISIPVYVADKGSSIGDTAIDMDGKMFDLQGNVLTLSGYEGVTVGIYDINGSQVIRFTPDSSHYSIALDLAQGVYAMGTDGCHRFKFMLK